VGKHRVSGADRGPHRFIELDGGQASGGVFDGIYYTVTSTASEPALPATERDGGAQTGR
jgi:hypothetical protein